MAKYSVSMFLRSRNNLGAYCWIKQKLHIRIPGNIVQIIVNCEASDYRFVRGIAFPQRSTFATLFRKLFTVQEKMVKCTQRDRY